VSKLTKLIRIRIGEVYAIYTISLIISYLLPYAFIEWFNKTITLPFTLGFTNVPGPQRPIIILGRKSFKLWNYFIPAGKTGLGIGIISYAGTLKINCITDDTVMKDPQVLIDLIDENVKGYIKMASDKLVANPEDINYHDDIKSKDIEEEKVVSNEFENKKIK
jgi:hypothetical protein